MNARARLENWIVAGVLVFFILIGIQCWRSRGQDAKADRDVATSKAIDRAHTAQTQASARVDTIVDTVWRSEATHKARGEDAARAADTAGQHAVSLRDTASMWHLRWQLRGVAIAEKDSALVAADLRADSLRMDRNRWHVLADSAVASQGRLRDDLRVARTGCRIVPLVPCLSRKQTLLVGLTAGALATWYVEERRRKPDKSSETNLTFGTIRFR